MFDHKNRNLEKIMVNCDRIIAIVLPLALDRLGLLAFIWKSSQITFREKMIYISHHIVKYTLGGLKI